MFYSSSSYPLGVEKNIAASACTPLCAVITIIYSFKWNHFEVRDKNMKLAEEMVCYTSPFSTGAKFA